MAEVGPSGDRTLDMVNEKSCYNSSESPRRPLRRPHTTPADTTSPNVEHKSANKSVSTLNASAIEFVPGEKKLNVNCSEFVPMYQQSQVNTDVNNVMCDGAFDSESYFPAEFDLSVYADFQRLSLDRPPHLELNQEVANLSIVDKFKEVLYCVTMRPSIVDDIKYMTSYLADVSREIDNDSTLEEITALIIEQGTVQQNFRYTGARICGYIIDMRLDCPTVENFRKILLQTLQKEFNMTSDPARSCGFLMFVGELFLLLKTNKGQHYLVLRYAMYTSMMTLLTSVSDDIIKGVCQLLKLVGAVVDDLEVTSPTEKENYENIYTQLQQIPSQFNLNKTSQLLIDSVINQHKNNWGRGSTSSSLTDLDASVLDHGVYQNEPVFYGQHSETISRHQAGFDIEYDLSGVMADNSQMMMGSDNSESEMSADMEAHYEVFLRSLDRVSSSQR